MKTNQNAYFTIILILCLSTISHSKKFTKNDLEGRPIILVQKTACNHHHSDKNNKAKIITEDQLIQMTAQEKISSIDDKKQSILSQLDDSTLQTIESKISNEQAFRRNLRRSFFEQFP